MPKSNNFVVVQHLFVPHYPQKASPFRIIHIEYIVLVGKYKTQVISDCRTAIKNNSVSTLFKIIKTGSN